MEKDMKTLKINENYRIETDNDSSTLIFAEKRIRNKVGKNKKPTGETEEYLFTQPYYYNNIQSALRAYFLKTLDSSIDLKDCLDNIEQSMLEIKNLSF